RDLGADVLATSGSPAKAGPVDALKRAPPPPPLAQSAVPAAKPARAQPEPAIPATVIDLPSQRMYALALLGLLAAWKLYDALLLSVDAGRTSTYLFAKWSMLDAATWYAGWRLRIPRLALSAHAMYALIAVSVFVDANMFFLASSVVALALKPVAVGVASSCVRSVKGIPWLGPRLVGDSELLIDSFELDDAHILGRHTIHILPHSLTHMNPQGKSFCIDGSRQGRGGEPWLRRILPAALLGGGGRAQTEIPLLVNGTHPDTITYAYTSFETGQRVLRTIKNTGVLQTEAHAVFPALGNWVLATYRLPVSEVGAYEIFSVRDRRGLEFRTAAQAPPTIVVACPRAQLQWRGGGRAGDNFAVGSDGHASMCQRTDQDPGHVHGEQARAGDGLIEVVVEGYEPVEVTVVRLVNGHREAISLDGVQPRVLDGGGAQNETQAAAAGKWARFRARKAAFALSDTFLRAGEYVYKLESVRDAANHSAGMGDRGLFDGDAAGAGRATPYMARMQVHGRPAVKWADALLRAEQPLRLSDDRARESAYALALQLTGTAPWTVTYVVADAAGEARETRTFAQAAGAAIDARRAGTYHLLGVGDRHCAGLAQRANVTLERAARPAANVTAAAITAHECGGAIGALVELELAGRAPFAVHYRERNLRFPSSRPVTRVVRTQQRRHAFRVLPELAGTYELEFFQLDDDNYPSGLPIAAVVTQAVHAQPSARIDAVSGRVPARACMGEALELPVRLKGQGPWELVYNVVHENRRTSHTVSGIADESYTLALGAFAQAGEYTVELARVRDGNQCARDLADAAAVIRVREGGPRVAFQCPDNGLHVLDGEHVRIPIHVTGEFPVEVRYHRIGDPAGHVHTATVRRPSRQGASQADSVVAFGPGEYELLAASDVCAGTVDAQSSRCTVHVEPKPSAWFVTDSLRRDADDGSFWRLRESCEGALEKEQGGSGAFELGLSGSGPWKIEYRVDFWAAANARSGVPAFADRTQTRSLVALQASALRPECCEPGRYRYTLLSVRDERYVRPQLLLAAPEAAAPGAGVTVAEHVITPSPLAELRAYAPDGTPLDTSRSAFRRAAVRHCLAPGQSRSDGDAQTWAQLHAQLPVFRIEFAAGARAPFQAWVEVFPASGPSEVVHVRDIAGHSQPITLPDHVAAQIGRYHMRLVRTRDARGCEHQFVDAGDVGLGRPDRGAIAGGIEIEYIEAPNARPASSSPAASPARDVCVGDVLAFDLRGLDAWIVHYAYNSVRRSASASKRLFRRIADVPGNFTLERVCHRAANDCCSVFDDLSYAVHDIPRVRVSGGKNVYQDILEGDMVDIHLDLVGTPPFSFTWQRRGIADAKVLESHTVKDLSAFEYTISTASEGTFEVTFVQDRYCQYPKA
ncbi:hypothetical protein GGF43_003651, partial [Coemansia sp. RSA 2618]